MPHLRDRLHFSTLMVFMEFCRTRSVSQTAANLGKSKAHVSVQLKTFAEQSGLTLYSRAGGHYYVNEQGLSIGNPSTTSPTSTASPPPPVARLTTGSTSPSASRCATGAAASARR